MGKKGGKGKGQQQVLMMDGDGSEWMINIEKDKQAKKAMKKQSKQ